MRIYSSSWISSFSRKSALNHGIEAWVLFWKGNKVHLGLYDCPLLAPLRPCVFCSVWWFLRSWNSMSLTQGIVFFTLLKTVPPKPSKLGKINCNYVISYDEVLFAHVHSCLSPSIPACMVGSISVSMQYEQDDPKCSSPVFFETLQQSSCSKGRISPQH